MSEGELGNEFVSKKILKAASIDVPEEALGFYLKGKTLIFEVLEDENQMGTLMLNVVTQEVGLSDEQYAVFTKAGLLKEEGYRLGA